MTCNQCETGEGMYFGFTSICKDNKHPGSIGEHIYVCQLCGYTYLYCLNLLLLKMLEHFSIVCTKLDNTAKLACIN